ncbi:MAG: hypothetical protein ACYC1F_05140 [Gallionellaceae bacterium]
MNLSPWFKPSDPPEREGLYQFKDWLGHINYLEWWRGIWRNPKTYDFIPDHRIRAWRGLVKL